MDHDISLPIWTFSMTVICIWGLKSTRWKRQESTLCPVLVTVSEEVWVHSISVSLSLGVVGYCWNRKHLILTAPDVQHKRNGIFHTHLLLVSKLQGVQQLEEYEKSVQLIWNQRKKTWSRVVQTGRDEHETVISHVISYRRIGLHAIQQ